METTEIMIEQIVDAVAGSTSTKRQLHYFRESLRHLVRAAKSEYARDATRCVALSIGLPALAGAANATPDTRSFAATLLREQQGIDFQTHAPE